MGSLGGYRGFAPGVRPVSPAGRTGYSNLVVPRATYGNGVPRSPAGAYRDPAGVPSPNQLTRSVPGEVPGRTVGSRLTQPVGSPNGVPNRTGFSGAGTPGATVAPRSGAPVSGTALRRSRAPLGIYGAWGSPAAYGYRGPGFFADGYRPAYPDYNGTYGLFPSSYSVLYPGSYGFSFSGQPYDVPLGSYTAYRPGLGFGYGSFFNGTGYPPFSFPVSAYPYLPGGSGLGYSPYLAYGEGLIGYDYSPYAGVNPLVGDVPPTSEENETAAAPADPATALRRGVATSGSAAGEENLPPAGADPAGSTDGSDPATTEVAPATPALPPWHESAPVGSVSRESSPGLGHPDSLVEAVQEELATEGYYPARVDGFYGAETRDALVRFQREHHLSPTGRISTATLYALHLN